METFLNDLKHSIRKPKTLLSRIYEDIDYLPKSLKHEKNHGFPLLIPYNFFQRLKNEKAPIEVWNQYLIQDHEFKIDNGLIDPINDEKFLVAPQIIHRYQNRVLYLLNSHCPIHCRYCFRKNEFSEKKSLFGRDFPKSLQYLKEHKEIEEIIFTGGDPLMVENSDLEKCLIAFSQMTHLKYIRFHTRVPIVTPNRIDQKFIELIDHYSSKFKKFIFCLHVNHAWELKNDQIKVILEKLALINNCTLLSQSVLLKNVNDQPQTLVDLFRCLSELGVTPYYLHHPDRVKGAMHFYLSEKLGNEIFQAVRQQVPGWMLPRYVKDNHKIASKEQLQY